MILTTKIAEAATSAYVQASSELSDAQLSIGGWDIGSFLRNARVQLQQWGGWLLNLLGAVALVWGGVLLVKKLMGNAQTSQQTSWVTIGLLIIVGGALLAGGFTLVSTVGSGGRQTILDLGGGSILLP